MNPFLIGEEIAETTEAIGNLRNMVSACVWERQCQGRRRHVTRLKCTYRFVRAHVLCCVGILYRPVVPLDHAAETSSCFQEVSLV